jgi:hypothetical protein
MGNKVTEMIGFPDEGNDILVWLSPWKKVIEGAPNGCVPISIWEDMRRKREKFEEKCRFFLMVCLFCKVNVSELREGGRREQVKHK